jgi:hypothetical protein
LYKEMADLMREGAKLRPQAFTAMFSFPCAAFQESEEIKSCAIGALYEAVFGVCEYDSAYSAALNERFPVLLETVPEALWPEAFAEKMRKLKRPGSLRVMIMNLNDVMRWTREEIADWIESLPEKEAVAYVALEA